MYVHMRRREQRQRKEEVGIALNPESRLATPTTPANPLGRNCPATPAPPVPSQASAEALPSDFAL